MNEQLDPQAVGVPWTTYEMMQAADRDSEHDAVIDTINHFGAWILGGIIIFMIARVLIDAWEDWFYKEPEKGIEITNNCTERLPIDPAND